MFPFLEGVRPVQRPDRLGPLVRLGWRTTVRVWCACGVVQSLSLIPGRSSGMRSLNVSPSLASTGLLITQWTDRRK